MSKKKISELDSFTGNASEFVIVGVDTTDTTTKKANLAALIANIGDPRIKELTVTNLHVGDMLFYDRATESYCIVHRNMIAAVLADYDTTRYETNYDTYVGMAGGKARFIANDDAYSQTGMYQSDTAATSNYYRIKINNSVNGSITFSATSGNGSIASTTLTWTAGNTMTSIVALFTALNTSYITFAALADGTGVGLEIGGYGANTMTVTASSGCTITDLSNYAFLLSENPLVEIGDTYIPSAAYTYLNTATHKSFRGSAALSILSGLVGASASMLGNAGYDYSYRTGANFAKFKSWASASGENTFYSDGVNGSTASSSGHVMKKSRFESDVISSATGDALKMYEYYKHLFSDQSGSYADLREDYIAMYGSMTSLYDAYLMSHIADVAANSGIIYSMLGKGKRQTEAKADLANITYDYEIVPAYPPEYNANHYGSSSKDGFLPGTYYHPEPADIALMFRDDLMAEINTNISIAGTGTALANSMYRGSCADYAASHSGCFGGGGGVFDRGCRYDGYFRARPALALSLS